ncbi:hypothetical protein RMR21_022095 [Agrobacterium sp. rho-8.1]|nr:hypothetical protein [Agrobacterium sp. rho-8.1]
MCNLYTVRTSAAEVAAHFGAPNTLQTNAPEDVYPGTPGMVVTEKDGLRELRSMTWGFPLRLKTMKPEAHIEAVAAATLPRRQPTLDRYLRERVFEDGGASFLDTLDVHVAAKF